MQRFLRLLKYATYPFLVLSLLLLCAMGFGSAFVTDFTIENRTDVAVVVTPVGTVGSAGNRAPLPVKILAFPPLPAFRNGGYRLSPGESVAIEYDMDDINFSEIVVEVEPGRILQFVTDPNPTSSQYHGPAQKHIVIDDLSRLKEATKPAQAAAQAANRQSAIACVEYSLLFGPWFVYGVVNWLLRRTARRAEPRAAADGGRDRRL